MTAQNLAIIGKPEIKWKVGNGAKIETCCYISMIMTRNSLWWMRRMP